ncbi:hypothetical protein HY993_02695 [Candidatus Micrarchaeota archaeon]|nr:hypothetical protein [Candidatus Micrarchaeota archaeon]
MGLMQKTAGGKKTIHVLDLMCGSQRVAGLLAHRFPNHEIEYVGIDNFKRPGYRYRKPAGINFGAREFDPQEGVFKTTHLKTLDFYNKRKLAAALRILGRQKFDEIHLHMPAMPIARPNKSLHAIKALSNLLKPSGRIYALIEAQSPLLDFHLEQCGPEPSRDQSRELFSKNRQNIAKAAQSAGMKLEKYGLKAEEWVTSGTASENREKRVNETLENIIGVHTDWPVFVRHFMILKKGGGGK